MNYSALYMEEGGYPITRMIVADNIDEAFEKGMALAKEPNDFVGVILNSEHRRLVCSNDLVPKVESMHITEGGILRDGVFERMEIGDDQGTA